MPSFSVRAVENALGLEVPLNAQYIRNLIIGAHGIHDHIVHFYHLSALDWVDIVSALSADPEAASRLAQSLSDWPLNSAQHFRAVQAKLKTFVDSGQLGVFGSGYWGHPAMVLPPEVNLMAAAHYLQALDYQRRANQIVGILGGKTPHIQNLAVGGVANPINLNSQSTLTVERLMRIKAVIDEIGDFVNQVFLVDVAAVGALYADWTGYGAGVTNYLSVPDMPLTPRGRRSRCREALSHPVIWRAIARSRPTRTRISNRASRRAQNTPGMPIAAPPCTPMTAKRNRTIPTSKTTGNIPGSSRRPSTINVPRSGPWPMFWRCTSPVMNPPNGT